MQESVDDANCWSHISNKCLKYTRTIINECIKLTLMLHGNDIGIETNKVPFWIIESEYETLCIYVLHKLTHDLLIYLKEDQNVH